MPDLVCRSTRTRRHIASFAACGRFGAAAGREDRAARARGIVAVVPRASVVIGRASDLARAGSVLAGALAERAGTILVIGEAGVGKTTTLRAMVELAADRGFACALGSCAGGASGTSFVPFRAALRALGDAFGEDAFADVVDANPEIGA